MPNDTNSVEEPAMNRAQRRALAKQVSKGGVDLSKPLAPAKAPVKPVISVGYCWNEARGVSGFWHQSILQMFSALSPRFALRPQGIESGPVLSRARNIMVKRFLATEDDYLLMTDTDMVFAPEDVLRLHAANHSIAGALYYNAATGLAPWCTALVLEEGGEYIPLALPELPEPPPVPEVVEGDENATESAINEWLVAKAAYENLLDGPDYQPRKVAAVGMGLTLIKRAVVEAVASNYKHPFEYENDQGEDLTFCLRAAEYGFATHVVPRARIGHMKSVAI